MLTRNRLLACGLSVCLAAFLTAPQLTAQTEPGLQSVLDKEASATLAKYRLPSVAALVQVDGKVVAQSATGVRRIGESTPIERSDLWHLGSCTKAMTATLIARLVERGVMSFDTPLEFVLPELAPRMDARMKRATVAHLLNHTAGLASMRGDLTEYDEFLNALTGVAAAPGTPSEESLTRRHAEIFGKGIADIERQRWAIASHYLSRPPASEPGAEYRYSNVGYIVAAAIAEKRTGKSWEELLRAEVFAPLGITTGGFGAPGKARVRPADQPRGHRVDEKNGFVSREPDDPEADNLPAMGPSGTVHMSLPDWAKFAQDQLEGQLGRGKLLEPATYQRLHRPSLDDYALGWVVRTDAQRRVALLEHSGSNAQWYVDIRIVPRRNVIILSATNAGTQEASRGIRQLSEALLARAKAFD